MYARSSTLPFTNAFRSSGSQFFANTLRVARFLQRHTDIKLPSMQMATEARLLLRVEQ